MIPARLVVKRVRFAGGDISVAARRRMAVASGCSDRFSAMAAVSSTSRTVVPENRKHLRDFGLPSVSVPVLSRTTVCTRPSASKVDTTLDDRADARRATDDAEDASGVPAAMHRRRPR